MQQCIYCGTEIAENLETCPSCGMSLVESHTLKPGTIVGGKYEVVKKLGEGGFGITYIVKNTHISETEAMKELFIKSTCGRASTSKTNTNHVYSSQKQDFGCYKKKFLKEMGVLSKINHENIVRMFNTVLENNTAYGIMEYINGSTLKQKIRAKGKFSEEEVLELLFSVGSGLKKVHDMDLTHRDIKPDNILIDENGIYKIINFGLVKEYQEASVTISQVVSEGYSPKEQYRKKGKITPATDIYSLGMTLYAALTGELFPENSADRDDEDIEEDFQKSIDKLHISSKLRSILKKMTALKSKDRYQNFNEIFNELDDSRGKKSFARDNNSNKPTPEPTIDYEDITEDDPDSENNGGKGVSLTVATLAQKKEKTLLPFLITIIVIAILGGGGWYGYGVYEKDLSENHRIEREKAVVDSLQIVKTERAKVASDNKAKAIEAERLAKIERKRIARERKAEAAKKKRAKVVKQKMIFVKGGTFQMGSNESDNEKPIHSVTVGDFYIGKYEVTQKEWKEVMGSNPSGFKGDNLPVEKVSWNDIQEFLKKLNRKTGGNYRLPTEAEWEYAAKGGNKSRGYKYAGSNDIDEVAWQSGDDWGSLGTTKSVGIKQPNELGIYDMSGNVWELCSDWYGKDYYSNSPSRNPQGPRSGFFRVNRGGNWGTGTSRCRVAYRSINSPGTSSYYLGFRLVLAP